MSLTVEQAVSGVRERDRATIGRVLTLIESRRADHQSLARDILARLTTAKDPSGNLPQAHRVGVTGVPGVGKSTFIEALGQRLVERDLSLAVLAIDPSSTVTGGSILGDKTRMTTLANHPQAFVRPTPSAGSLGGVAFRTREAMLVCEAAGFDVVLIETVGVGQSEIGVADMVDSVLLLLLPGAGDELQGIKRGILERVDVVAVNKADGEALESAKRARIEYESALRFVRPAEAAWAPPVLACSGATGDGLDAVWASIAEHRRAMEASGAFDRRRRQQQLHWLKALIEDRLLSAFQKHPGVAERLPAVQRQVEAGALSPSQAAEELLDLYGVLNG